MKNFSSRFLKSFPCLILSVIFLYVPPCFADKGVFAARVTPDEIFADDLPVNIAVKAEIGDVPFNESVKVYQTTENGASIRLLCSMRFDKRRYFTGQFTIADKRSDPFCFKIVAVYNNKEKIAGPVQKVALLVRVPAADIAR